MSFLVVLTLIGLSCAEPYVGSQKKADDKDLERFRNYLSKNHAGMKWKIGPKEISSEAIRKAFPKRRFYYVFSAPPPHPPGARFKGLEAYRKRQREFRKKYLSLIVSIDHKGNVTPRGFSQPQLVRNRKDARVVAAAVMSLIIFDKLKPYAVSPNLVRVEKLKSEYVCTFTKEDLFFAKVWFASSGELTRFQKSYSLP